MTIERLSKARETRPFRPFTVRLADGRSFPVPHPDFIAHSPKGRNVIVFGRDSDEFSILDLLLVTELEFEATDAANN